MAGRYVRPMDLIDFPNRPGADPGLCRHHEIDLGLLGAERCPLTNELRWTEGGEERDPAEALARLFGQFELRAVLDGLHAPGPSVFVYSPPNRPARSLMRRLPTGAWLAAAPGLWITQDGTSLLMSPDDPVLAANLARNG